MTLQELFAKCRKDTDLCKNYIKQYEKIRNNETDRILHIQWHDICSNEEVNALAAPRTKGVALGLIRQSMISNSEKIKKIDEIIKQLKEFL